MSTALSSLDTTLDAPPSAMVQAEAAALPAPVPGRFARRWFRRGPVSSAAAKRSPWWLEGLTILWLCWVYDAVTNLAPLRLGAALEHGRAIIGTERSLGISPEHALDRWLASRHTIGVIVSYYYDNAHFIVTLGLLGYLWWRRDDIFRPLRSTLVLINVAGFVVFWRYPVAPPRMIGGFTDVVASSHALGSWHTGSLASDANQLAAMPSLHIAWAVWCSVAVWSITSRPVWRALGVAYPFVTAFAVLATGNHYVLDIVGGALLTALCFIAVSLAPRAWARIGLARARAA